MGGTVFSVKSTGRTRPRLARLAAAASILALAGCSADVSRFDFPSFGLTDTTPRTATVPPAPLYPAQPGYPAYPGPAQGYQQPAYPQPGYQQPGYQQGYQGAPAYGGGYQGGNGYVYNGGRDPLTGRAAGRSSAGSGAGGGYGAGQPYAAPSYQGQYSQQQGYQGSGNGAPAGMEVANIPSSEAAGKRASYGDAAAADPAPSAVGTVEVRQGDTLYSLARSHNVAVSALMKANGLRDPNLHLGQKLVIPAGATKVVAPHASTTLASAGKATKTNGLSNQAEQVPAASGDSAAADGETYKVQNGESLYGIARKLNVKVSELARVNNISDPAKMKPGQVLLVPGRGLMPADGSASAEAGSGSGKRVASLGDHAPATDQGGALATADSDTGGAASGDDAAMATGEQAPESAAVTSSKRKRTSSGKASSGDSGTDSDGQQLASANQSDGTDMGAAPATDSGQFRWPVRGRVIAKFGKGTGSQQNDGINIAVPQGTEVKAAESGVVAYAGNELKGYGNLILIRHADDWVSAYAHNDEILVKRGDQVRRGQVIAKAGKTGSVYQPQVHFELRKGSQPVDPLPHLAGG